MRPEPEDTMSVEIVEEAIVAGVAALHCAPAGARDRPLPTVFFFHNFTASKEVCANFGYVLARAGFRVVLPDAPDHGSRFDGDAARRGTAFWDVLRRDIEELAAYRDAFQNRGLIDGDRVGVCGASLGGFVAYGAMVAYPWVTAAAAFMGTGYFDVATATAINPPIDVTGAVDAAARIAERIAGVTRYSAAGNLQAFAGRPMLVWQGVDDPIVPVAHSLRFQAEMRAGGLDGRLTVVLEPGVGHKTTPGGLAAATAFFSGAL
jgi:fermentation-respiration switch protein FrsA (DUF1100 family)